MPERCRFRIRKLAEELLASLKTFPSVESAYLVDHAGTILATYPAHLDEDPPDFPVGDDYEFTQDGFLLIRHTIVEDAEVLGTLVLRANLENFYARVRDYVLILSGIMLFSLCLSIFLSIRLQRAISTPIAKLVSASRTVTEKQDYSTRVNWRASNELGNLCSTFDQMLNEIQRAENEIQAANTDLEKRVEQRTAQLTEEIRERKRVFGRS